MKAEKINRKFEDWIRSINQEHLLTRHDRNDDTIEYTSAGTQHKWLAWQAALKHK